jgi:sporulation protein YabP
MENTETKGSLVLYQRKKLSLSGIEDVISFDELSIYLVTDNGNLLIEGTDLHITVLDITSGNMTVEGMVRSIIYNDKATSKKENFFSRMIK